MTCECHSLVYRALVTYSNSSTGEILVKIPAVTGIDSVIPISYIGRSNITGVWNVPDINDQIIVSADDHNLSNVFWLRTDERIDIPTTPLYATTAGSALDTGLVFLTTTTFANSTGIALNDIFSDTYTNYRFVINLTSGTLAGHLHWRMRSGGANYASNDYYSNWLSGATGGATGAKIDNASWFGGYFFSGAYAVATSGYMDMYNPFVSTVPTHFSMINQNYQNNRIVAGTTTVNASYDGIYFAPMYLPISTVDPYGTMSGTITVYGYKK